MAAHNGTWKLSAPVIGALAIAVLLLAAAVLYVFEPWVQAPRQAAVQPRESLDAYSWAELSSIAEEISKCSDRGGANSAAARYGLCESDGALRTDQRKAVVLADGTSVQVVLAGIWHDTRTDGAKAGLTFAFAAAPAQHAMNHAFESAQGLDADSVGGWAASDMRSWLAGDFFYLLPPDLRAHIVEVQKVSASAVGSGAETVEAGHVGGSAADWANATGDKLWLFSASELCGQIPETEDLDIDESIARIYGAEGEQYPLFAEVGVQAFEPAQVLVRTCGEQPCTWWLRTKTLEFGEGFWLVGTDGTALNGIGEDARALSDEGADDPGAMWGPDHARGVVAGFCL